MVDVWGREQARVLGLGLRLRLRLEEAHQLADKWMWVASERSKVHKCDTRYSLVTRYSFQGLNQNSTRESVNHPPYPPHPPWPSSPTPYSTPNPPLFAFPPLPQLLVSSLNN